MSKRLDLKFFRVNCQKIDTPECFIVPFPSEKLIMISLLKEVKPSPDRKR